MTNNPHPTYRLTALGAAIVEALPDQALVKKIRAHFKRTGKILKVKKPGAKS